MVRKFMLAFMIITLSFSASYADEVDDLLNYYVKRFNPETAELMISDKPDKTGRFKDLYMNLRGVVVANLRMERLTFRMMGVQFNEPSEWAKGNVECVKATQVDAFAHILEGDINKAIEAKTFGKKDKWHHVSMAITPEGLKGKGYYKADVGLFNFDILLEITSGLKIVRGKELWLNNPVVKVNKLDAPDNITRKALSRIQPLVDLDRVNLPLTLHKVELNQGNAVLSTHILPQVLTRGLKYSYKK